MLNKFLNTLFPESCPVCRMPATDHTTAPICNDCWQSIAPYHGPRCRTCGRPLVSGVSLECGDCIQHRPAFDSAGSFGLYDGVLRQAINQLKYHNIKRLSKPLSEMVLQMKLPRVDAVLPVPLYKTRLKQREFNQSALIAKNTGEHLGCTMLPHALVKIRDTKPQVGLRSGERRANIRKAFAVQSKELIEGKDILIIDDVITTGATVSECAKTVKKAGAARVHVIALAHGIMD